MKKKILLIVVGAVLAVVMIAALLVGVSSQKRVPYDDFLKMVENGEIVDYEDDVENYCLKGKDGSGKTIIADKPMDLSVGN